MRSILNQRGASHIVAILAIIVIAGVGFVGWRVMNADNDKTNTPVTSETASQDITNSQDVEQASTSLDELDSDLNPEQLDEDLNSLL